VVDADLAALQAQYTRRDTDYDLWRASLDLEPDSDCGPGSAFVASADRREHRHWSIRGVTPAVRRCTPSLVGSAEPRIALRSQSDPACQSRLARRKF